VFVLYWGPRLLGSPHLMPRLSPTHIYQHHTNTWSPHASPPHDAMSFSQVDDIKVDVDHAEVQGGPPPAETHIQLAGEEKPPSVVKTGLALIAL
jgi:hypothetical protein